MRYFFFLILLSIVSCKTYHSKAEFSTYSNRNQIKIKKVNNLRYLGGIKNAEGKTLKDSLIYRSGNLHKLRNSSFDEIKLLKISKIIDLRTHQEITDEPDHLPEFISYQNLPAFEDENGALKDAKKQVLKGRFHKADADKRMTQFYKNYVSENPEVIKKIVTEILDSSHPILYHCTAGKDRTGMITALILKILKFDNTVIFEEYLQSNNLREKIIQKRLKLANNLHFIYPKLDIGVLEKTGWIERDYLQSAFDEIDQQYRSIDYYIHQALGISEERREIYIQKFLQ
ncbi:tyrosine-protein phosphatase [Epilithonimonas mollis]|uniref:Protein-tyrosine phosphatase n=1 Tax=Epilithonimonas mollis TaxID=216903 RepID=A0A1M6T771_9FLAO|nr:tyrosine-protein phosphatase [Epilithonimonas mollis]SHK52726.1 protein-tyrosine phosphatase [Epilithonimonas mollis]